MAYTQLSQKSGGKKTTGVTQEKIGGKFAASMPSASANKVSIPAKPPTSERNTAMY